MVSQEMESWPSNRVSLADGLTTGVNTLGLELHRSWAAFWRK